MGCSRSAAFAVCKKFFKSRTVFGRPEKLVKVFDGHVTLPVLSGLLAERQMESIIMLLSAATLFFYKNKVYKNIEAQNC